MTIAALSASQQERSPITLKRCDLISAQGKIVDIRHLASELHIFESMRNKAMYGYIVLNDGVGLFEDFPILAEEKLLLEFITQNHENNLVDEFDYPCRMFEITKVDGISQESFGVKKYRLHFISHEAKLDLFITLRKSFRNMKSSAIVQELLTKQYPYGLGVPVDGRITDYDKTELNITETKYNDRVIVAQKTPLEAAVWLATRSVGDGGSLSEPANYVFFENMRGFQFTSIEQLIQKAAGKSLEELPRFFYGGSARMVGADGKRLNPFEVIHNYKIVSSFDFVRNLVDGVYTSDAAYYNLLSGEVENIHFDYLNNFKRNSNVESTTQRNSDGTETWGSPTIALNDSNKNPITKVESVVSMFIPTYPTMYEEKPENMVSPKQYIQQRLSQMKRFNDITIELEVMGNTRIHAGDIINVELSKPEGETLVASRYRGRFMVRDIHHIITSDDYRMFMTAMKDCFLIEDAVGGSN